MKLGQILMHRRLLARDQRREALRRQQDRHDRIGEILLGMGAVSHTDVVEGLRSQPAASIEAADLALVKRQTAHSLPEQVARRYGCLAVYRDTEVLVVAMADPLDRPVIDALGSLVGLSIVPIAADGQDLEVAIDRLYERDPGEASGDAHDTG